MKNNHLEVESLLTQAIKYCMNDRSLSYVQQYLSAAVQELYKVDKKRNRNIVAQKYLEEGKKKNQEWWDMIKKNAAENLNFDLEQ